MQGQWFAHSGDLGDIVYALPAIRAAGGGTLFLFHTPGKTWHGMTQAAVDTIKPLLMVQPYIKDVVFCPDGHSDSTLNGFRDHWRPGRNLADMHLATMGFGPEGRYPQWLQVEPSVSDYRVIFARSERCRNQAFPWKRIFEAYREMAVFVGLPHEHQQFVKEVGPLPFLETRSFLELAQIISGSLLFVGNQSAPTAIAEGLKATMILEVCPEMDNCRFDRINRINVVNGEFELPDLRPYSRTYPFCKKT